MAAQDYQKTTIDKRWQKISIAAFAASRGLPKWPKIESGGPMVTPHLPWKFHANRSSRFLVGLILLTKKQTKKEMNKEIDRKQYPVKLKQQTKNRL